MSGINSHISDVRELNSGPNGDASVKFLNSRHLRQVREETEERREERRRRRGNISRRIAKT